MNSRERILAAINHQPVDRLPTGFDAHAEVEQGLFQHFGVDNLLDLYQAMDIDGFSVFTTSYVYPKYIGPSVPEVAGGIKCDFFGIHPEHHANPLAFAGAIGDLDDYRWPSAEWFDYREVKARCLAIKERGQVTVGGEGGCGIQHAINLRGYAQALMDPAMDPDFTHAYMQRMGDFFVDWNERWLGAAAGEFDIFRCGDDMGSNTAMHCSPAMWREFYKPQLRRIFAVAKDHGLKIWFHCCGCCRPVIEDLIEIGVDLWDPVPAYTKGNDQEELKRRYGRQLAFIGGVDEPNVLAHGTPAQVRAEVERTIATLGPTGYILGGSQVLTRDVPIANVLAMYAAAREFSTNN